MLNKRKVVLIVNNRKLKILTAVVDEYIRTGEPVGSKAISKLENIDVSSATIRNDMAVLEQLGYLEQPHTSAGRIPTFAGYRLYIDELMNPTEKDKGVKLTIPEGFSAEMIAARCEKLGLVKAEDFLSELENGKFGFSFINDIPSKDGVKYKLQGYLFPSTYVFKSTASAHDVISVLLAEFEKQYNSVKNLNKNEVSMNDIIISASLIEREAKLDSERSMISGVIRNRIKKGMRLQIDASVVYAISDGLYDVSRVYYKDLEKDSPYNTYKYAGLPVGAICNPGIKSIKAAMQPQESNYLYYRTDNSKNDGSHIFTETFNEHKSKAK